ncbi:hypothetical protein GCM10023231_18320 [Olivibacter ginsenosidimutans]|uniref:TIR domain-containing protein n=1 Tax=Olivibacter ginsenosidimutans TaxID=1176537 RepID=A0ABP9B7M8_9SPHI
MKQQTFKEKIGLFFGKLMGKSVQSSKYRPHSKETIENDSQASPLSPDLSAINPQRVTTKKDTYKCFTFMLYERDSASISQRILEHDRLHLVTQSESLDHEDENLVENAKKADILFFSSGDRVFDIDRFLEKVGIYDKMIVVVSTYDPYMYKEWIKGRVDCHFRKREILVSEYFEIAMKPVLDDLDGIASLPNLIDEDDIDEIEEGGYAWSENWFKTYGLRERGDE